MPKDVVTALGLIAKAVDSLTKLLSQWLTGSEKRRMRRAIESGENYIRRNNKIGPRNDKLLKKHEKDFWKFNN